MSLAFFHKARLGPAVEPASAVLMECASVLVECRGIGGQGVGQGQAVVEPKRIEETLAKMKSLIEEVKGQSARTAKTIKDARATAARVDKLVAEQKSRAQRKSK